MKRTIRGAAFAAPLLIVPAAQAQWSAPYTAPRNATVDAAGAKSLEVEAAAGELRVEGKAGLRQVQITGTARSSSQQLLTQIKLIAERRGDVIFIKADMPDESWRNNFNNNIATLDLVIEVPKGIDAEITDGSGDARISDVGSLDATDGSGDFSVVGAGGTVRITDGSGDLKIENIGGDVTVRDGSGDVNARNITGSFTVESDGSGGIYATDVRGSVIVQSDGSGDVEATKVGKDFRVESKGSGDINYTEVSGQVDIPDRDHGRHRHRSDR
jgi:putative adhesin